MMLLCARRDRGKTKTKRPAETQKDYQQESLGQVMFFNDCMDIVSGGNFTRSLERDLFHYLNFPPTYPKGSTKIRQELVELEVVENKKLHLPDSQQWSCEGWRRKVGYTFVQDFALKTGVLSVTN